MLQRLAKVIHTGAKGAFVGDYFQLWINTHFLLKLEFMTAGVCVCEVKNHCEVK